MKDDQIEIQKTKVINTSPEEEVVTTTKTIDTTPHIRTEHPQKVYDTKKTIFRTHQIIWYLLGVIEVLLGLRLALKVLGANPFSGFTSLIYGVTDLLVLPFSGILRSPIVGNSVFEWATLIAALIYALIAYGVVQLILLVKPVTPEEVEVQVDNPTM